ncbi:Hypothetical predicted protein [Mytilus galloprovincialis]|uniref:One cut domain family member n=1 Tax=Mytilus galloprovincialis TaxID=29158 RepID=A0A8B6CYG9_MYTGA|nr:Hypothetical predicted protein [Mytilus galloprovincialis]
MDAHTSTTLEALERTAAWVQQVQNRVEEMKNSPSSSALESTVEEMNIVDEDDVKMEPCEKDDNSLTDHHDEALKMAQTFPPYIPKGKNGKAINYSHIDVKQTVKDFKEALEKFGISQRFACTHIMENTSQGNLSFLLDKGKNKLWSEISPRGRIPYIRMRRWLDSPEEQKATMDLLHKSKDYKKGTRISGDTVLTKREKFSVFQLLVLCRVFEEDNNPSLSTRALLADKLEAPLERITIWFQNQRARGFPAKKFLKESNMGKDPVDIQSFSGLSPKKDHGMRKSNTPLSNGPSSSNSNSQLTPQQVESNKQSVPLSQEHEAHIQSCISSVLGSSIGQNLPTTSSSQMSTAQMPPFPFPLQLLSMAQQPVKSEQSALSLAMTTGQTYSPFLGFPPSIFTSAQTNVPQNTVTDADALNLMRTCRPMTIKQEPRDPSPFPGNSD